MFQTINVEPTADLNAFDTLPLVEVDGQVLPGMWCDQIIRSGGIVPGTARLQYFPDLDATGAITLKRYDFPFGFGSRVRVMIGDKAIFLGQIMRRMDQGQSNSVIWEAVDDLHWLTTIPIRGALVYDDGEVKFLSRYEAHFNPKGFWNCTYATINSVAYPVFSPRAQRVKSYEAPNEGFDGTQLADGTVTAWTPRRALQYLYAVAFGVGIFEGSVDGVVPEHWRTLRGNRRVTWLKQSVDNIKGVDPTKTPTSSTDPLDRKLPDISIRGMKLLGALDKVLKAAGTHELTTYPTAKDSGVTSNIWLYPIGYSGVGSGRYIDIRLQRGGDATDANTIYDFSLTEDATEVAESVLVEGAPVMLETSVSYTATSATDALVPAWTTAEQGAWLAVVNGGVTTSDGGRYAKLPLVQDSTTVASFVDADGTGGKPLILARTNDAVRMASKIYPRVWQAWTLKSELITGMAGQGSEYSSTASYPVLSGRRQILPEQLQYMLRDLTGSDDETNKLLVNYPIRIQTRTTASDDWQDVTAQHSVMTDQEGLIWIRGLSAEIDGRTDEGCVYTGGVINVIRAAATLRHIKINCAMPMDHRVSGYWSMPKEGEKSEFVETYRSTAQGLPMAYIDSPQAYNEAHQVASEPAPHTSYLYNSTSSTSPLTRILPPGSEAVHATDAALRRLDNSRFVRRESSWSVIGIRLEYYPGQWVRNINVTGGDAADQQYRIDSPIGKVVWDFDKQHTVIGGIVNTIGGG